MPGWHSWKWLVRPLLAKRQRGGGYLPPPGFLRGCGFAVFPEKEGLREHQHPAKPLWQETVIAHLHNASTFHVSFRLNGPRGRSRTCNLPGLSGTPLLLGYTRLARQAEALAKTGAPGQDCTDTKRGLSPLPLPWATGAEMVLALKTREPAVRPPASLSPGRDPQRPISAQTIGAA